MPEKYVASVWEIHRGRPTDTGSTTATLSADVNVQLTSDPHQNDSMT